MFVDSVTELRTEAAPKTHRVKQICDKHRWHGALRTLPARVSPENSDTAPGVPETSGVRVNVIVLTITSDTKNKNKPDISRIWFAVNTVLSCSSRGLSLHLCKKHKWPARLVIYHFHQINLSCQLLSTHVCANISPLISVYHGVWKFVLYGIFWRRRYLEVIRRKMHKDPGVTFFFFLFAHSHSFLTKQAVPLRRSRMKPRLGRIIPARKTHSPLPRQEKKKKKKKNINC